MFLELRSSKYLYPPRAHEELAGGGNKVEGYNKKVNLKNVIIINFIFYMHGVVVIPHDLDLVDVKQDFGFCSKMTQSKSDKVNATLDGIGTIGIKLICLLCRKVPKTRNATNLSQICYLSQVSKLQNHLDS